MIKIVAKIFNKCSTAFFKTSKHLLFKIFAILLFIISSQAFSQAVRFTTFDDRPVCEEVRGVWRQFGDGCIDECSAKFDKFSICPQVLAYGCDCGRNRCWNGDTCIMRKDYKKIFDEERAQEKKILDVAKDKRKSEAKANQQFILNSLAKKNEEKITDEDLNQLQNQQIPGQAQPSGKPIRYTKYGANNPSINPRQPIRIYEQPVNTPLISPEEKEKQDAADAAKLKEASQVPENNIDPSLIPPFYQQLEKAKKDAANAAKLKDAAKVPENNNKQDPVIPISTLPGLPVVPLPQ